MLLIHCGYPKTATTSLQKWVFPNIARIDYLGRRYNDLLEEEQGLYRELLPLFRIDNFKTEHERVQDEKAAKIALRRTMSRDARPKLVSVEGIIGQCLAPTPNILARKFPTPAPKFRCVAKHIKKQCSEAGVEDIRLLFTIRPQAEFLASFFSEAYMDRYSRIPQTKDFKALSELIINGSELIDEEALHYSRVEDICSEYFGQNGVEFISMDWLKSEKKLFAERLSAFLNVRTQSVFCAMQNMKSENVRLDKSLQYRIRRKNAAFFLDKFKSSLFPGKSIGVGRFIRRFLNRIEYGQSHWKPEGRDLEKLKSHFSDDTKVMSKRHPRLFT